MPRTDIHFRIDTAKFQKASDRAKKLGYSTFNQYLEHLLDDDLLVQFVEERKELLASVKGASK